MIGPGGRNPHDHGRSFIFLLGSGGNTQKVLRPYRRSMGGSLSPCNSSVTMFIWGLNLKNWVPPAKPVFLRDHSSQGHGGSAATVGCQVLGCRISNEKLSDPSSCSWGAQHSLDRNLGCIGSPKLRHPWPSQTPFTAMKC